jgi:hypothetical protein
MPPDDKLVLPDDRLLQSEAGGATITIRVSRESHYRLAVAAERSGVSIAAFAEQLLKWALLDAPQKKGRGRPSKQRFDRLYDNAIDLLLVTEVLRRPKGKITQTIKHLEKKEPFKGYKDLRSRYNKEAKRLRGVYGLKELPRSKNGQEGWNMRLRRGGELHHPRKVLEAIDAMRQSTSGPPQNTKKEWADRIARREKTAWLLDAMGAPSTELLSLLEELKKCFEEEYGQE